MCAITLIFAIISLSVLRPNIAPLRFAIRTAYNFGIALVIVSLLLLISAMILEVVLT